MVETKYELVSELLANSDFCLLQEHWMYPERFLEVAKKEFKDIQCIVTSPMNENELTYGRPRGGTAILYNSKINAKVEKLDTGCNRLTAALITLDNINLLLITVICHGMNGGKERILMIF